MAHARASLPDIEKIRHSLAHLLAAAVQKRSPKVTFGIGPTIEDGFYYDFLFPKGGGPAEADFPALEEEMRAMIAAGLSFRGSKATPAVARKVFVQQPFKLELIEELRRNKKPITIYSTGSVFTDLCRGGHVKNTREIPADAFKLTKIAGAYWRGDEKNAMLLRVYGVAFATGKELEAYLAMMREAERRDHKKLGRELNLFVFSDLVGGGLPLFTPKGTIIRDELEQFVQSLQIPRGYMRVRIPHITKRALYETSGHWQKFRDELFKITTREGHEFALKPMNCPHHTQIYASERRSYRELPLRYSEVTAVYRDEQSGELSGLSRVRAITQDDAHVFCRMSQIEAEALSIWNIVDEFYKPFGMPLTVRFSRHDPKQMDKYLGTPAVWRKAETQLKSIIVGKTGQGGYLDGPGEAAMYGPKIDFIAKDSLGREWQLATIQLDFNLPERFGLSCINERGKEERIVMIHRAIMGSVERFLSVLIEHYAGAFPVWLAPVQALVLPISEKQYDYALIVGQELKRAGIRLEVGEANETIGKRIREAEIKKVPYILVVGDREREDGTVAVRRRSAGAQAGRPETYATPLNEFIEKLLEDIREKK